MSPRPPMNLAGIIRSEFLEMPCLRVTLAEAERFWAAPAPHCVAALDDLTTAGFLTRASDGRYARARSEAR